MRWAISLVWLAFSVWIYRGFFYPDPLTLGASSISENVPPLLLLIWLVAPIVLLLPLLSYWLVRVSVLRSSSVALAGLGIIIAALVSFPVLSELWQRKENKRNLEQYHSFLGLKPPAYQAAKEDATKLFFLGGSTTAWPDSKGKDWPSRVEELLKQKLSGQRIEASNLGLEWYSSAHSLFNFSHNLQQHKPDFVIIMHGINDLLLNADFSIFSLNKFRRDYGHFLGPTRELIKRQSFLQMIAGKLSGYWYHKPRALIETTSFPGLQSFRDNLSTLSKLCNASGTQLILMTQPNLYRNDLSEDEKKTLYMLNVEALGETERWSFKTALAGINAYNEATRSLARELQLPLIELESAIPKSLEYFTDDVHYTDKAYPLIAEAVSEGLKGVLSQQEQN